MLLQVGDTVCYYLTQKQADKPAFFETYADENFLLMQTVKGDPTPTIWQEYFDIANANDDNLRKGNLERFAFYERAKNAYAVIATGESAVYANIILKKGVIKSAYCVDNDCAIEFVNGKFTKVISAGGKAYMVSLNGQEIVKQELQ